MRDEERTADVIRRALRLLDREAWLARARADAERLSDEDRAADRRAAAGGWWRSPRSRTWRRSQDSGQAVSARRVRSARRSPWACLRGPCPMRAGPAALCSPGPSGFRRYRPVAAGERT